MQSDDRTDAELVLAARRKDRSAFTALVRRYEILIPALAYALTGSLEQSEEVAQEAFLSAWKHLGDLREPARFRSWIYGIVRNLCRAYRRQAPPNALLNAADFPSQAPSPLEFVISQEEERMLWR